MPNLGFKSLAVPNTVYSLSEGKGFKKSAEEDPRSGKKLGTLRPTRGGNAMMGRKQVR